MKNSFNNIEIDYKPKEQTSILAHKSEFIQLIIIVLSNAVEILSIRDSKDKKIMIKADLVKNKSCDKNSVRITIEDTAGGISAGDMNTIFTPYFTTKEQSGGTGLGLYIAKIIVEQKMNGVIDVCNTPRGAKFSIVI